VDMADARSMPPCDRADAGDAPAIAHPPYPAAAEETLEDANIKLDSVISDILGLSGRRMIEALIAGETEPGALAALAHRRIKADPAELEAALRGRVTRHHRFLLGLHVQQIDAPGLRRGRRDAAIDQIDPEVDALVEPFRTAVDFLTTIPGITNCARRRIADCGG
jgi:transposase